MPSPPHRRIIVWPNKNRTKFTHRHCDTTSPRRYSAALQLGISNAADKNRAFIVASAAPMKENAIRLVSFVAASRHISLLHRITEQNCAAVSKSQIKIVLKFTRILAFRFTLCIVKIIKFNAKLYVKFYDLLRCDLPNGAARRIHHFDLHIRKARPDGIRDRKILFHLRLRALFYQLLDLRPLLLAHAEAKVFGLILI